MIDDIIDQLEAHHEAYHNLLLAVRDRFGTCDDVLRFLDNPEQIAEIIVPSISMTGKPLTDHECIVRVENTIPHDKMTLEASFSKDCIHDAYLGEERWLRGREWKLNPLCQTIDHTQEQRIMLAKQFTQNETERLGGWKEKDRDGESMWCLNGDIINEFMQLQGYRPATYVEGYFFASTNPELQQKIDVMCLGSYFQSPLGPLYPFLDACEDGSRRFVVTDYPLESFFTKRNAFLFVRL